MILPLLMLWTKLVKFVTHHIAFVIVYALHVTCVVGHPFNIEQPCKMSDRDMEKWAYISTKSISSLLAAVIQSSPVSQHRFMITKLFAAFMFS